MVAFTGMRTELVAGRASEVVQMTRGVTAHRTGATFLTPVRFSLWGKSYAELGRFDEALRSVDEAKEMIKRTGETWFEVHVHCIAGEIGNMDDLEISRERSRIRGADFE